MVVVVWGFRETRFIVEKAYCLEAREGVCEDPEARVFFEPG